MKGYFLAAVLACPALAAPPAADRPARLSEELWQSAQPIYAAILAHPFLKGLTDGSLPEEAFRYYVVQDALYLRDFSRALSLSASKAPKDSWSGMFAGHAQACLLAERSLHQGFFKEWGLAPEAVYRVPMAPTNLSYTSYMLRVGALGSFEELLGAVLPCYWIYWEVGKALKARGSPNPLYRRWIDTYASEEYGASVSKVIAALDEAAAGLPESRRAEIRRHFLASSRYEWMFWDAAWRKEAWPEFPAP